MSQPPEPPTKRPLSILAFGDSLTEGYTQWGLRFTPYSTFLLSYLQSHLGDDYEITIRTEGVSGDLIVEDFEERMEEIYKEGNVNFDYLIFLGGTNDLGHGLSPSTIFSALLQTLNHALKSPHPPRILILTVPECGAKSADLDRRREELNALIRNWADGTQGAAFCDLWEKVKYHSMEESERDSVWDDGLHFTEKGYRRVGEVVGECLVDGIQEEDGLRRDGVIV